MSDHPLCGNSVAAAIWMRNAELGQAERMWRISRAKHEQIPFLYLDRAVKQLMLFLHKAKVERHQSDLRDEEELLRELALVYAIINHEMRKEIGARRLRDDLLHELGARDMLELILEADLLVAPDEEIVSDPASARSEAALARPVNTALYEAPDPSRVIVRVRQ